MRLIKQLGVFKEVNEHYKNHIKHMNTHIRELNELINMHRASEAKLASENLILKNENGRLIRKD